MSRPREFDQNEALDAAINLFWEKGYAAASLSDLTDQMGIQRPSLYGTYGNKWELFQTALARYQQVMIDSLRATLEGHSDKKAAIGEVFRRIVEATGEDSSHRGCFFVNSMVELGPHHPDLAAKMRTYQADIAAVFQETIERGIAHKQFDQATDAQALGRFLTVSYAGLQAVVKTHPDPSFIGDAVAMILKVLP